ncbi:two-component system, OmpR family, phosphate regulon sensor histidine kinase PhoR [Thermoflexales bacterium]|nr:two-component system, OmpR family, phosphate regulon sensor histidine kinase PhoR [Thermoflexales bacterium]
MALDRRIIILRNAFPSLSEDMLAYVAQNAREIRVAPGDRICTEGELGDAVYFILSGRVQVSKFLELGTQHLLNELHAGQFFGELALVEDAPRMASVDALEETALLVITKDDFQDLLTRNPETAMPIMRSIASRLRDSDRRSIEELREKNEELAQAYLTLKDLAQRKSDFLTVVAHELRTPLTAIKGYGHFMRLGTLQGETLNRAVTAIVNNTDAIVRLINNILFLQELELIEPAFEPVDVPTLVNAILTTMRPGAADQSLTFQLELPSDLPSVSADLDGLTQAIGALIDNAVKFSPNGGAIVIAAHVEEGQLRLSIQDPGVGIQPDQMYHIFDRYHHLESAGEHLFGGVGLGLPIAKQVVEQHGGNISVVSQPGAGSTFTLTIPIERKNGRA